MSYKTYDTYVDSNIDIIGLIPKEYDIVRLKFLCDIKTGDKDTVNRNPEGKYPFYVRSPIVERIDTYSFDGESVLMAGDGVGAGKVFHYANGKFDFHQRVYNLHNFKQVDPKFLYYYMSSLFSIEINKGSAKSTVDSVRLPMLENFLICYPNIFDQKQIANYLDKQIDKIDVTIAKNKKLIELHEEKRITLINQVVTKGLNPDAPMKDSGIDWIGEIPKHYSMIKISNMFNNIGSGTTPKSSNEEYYVGGNLNWLITGDLNDDYIYETSTKITTKALHDVASLKIYPKDSLVIAMYGATIGKLGILKIETCTNQACCVLSRSNNLNIKYAYYWFLGYRNEIISLSYGGGQPNISQDVIKNLKIIVPPLNEQSQIVDNLDKEITKIDTIISKINENINLLEEYKTSLIHHVVTGKIDVRGEEI